MSTLVLVGAQWGDEGKGKIVDFLSEEADMVVRYQGGANAGHTVVVGGREYKLHLIPSGVLNHKVCVIGNGVVIDPAQLLAEMDGLTQAGYDVSRVYVSDCAHVILPYHKLLDALEEQARGDRKIGTTGRGIGPAYRDKSARAGIRMADLFHPERFRDRLLHHLDQVNSVLERVYHARPLDGEALVAEYLAYADRLRAHVTDTSALVNDAIDRGHKVLFEGAQGTLLDIDHGTYPYVTSSHPTAGGACIGAGVGPTRIDSVMGVAKAYTTRVGDGPFPTEETGATGAWLRERGREFGTTTGRPRRCGWLDAVALRYAVRVNGLASLALTKLDTLTGLDTVRVAVAYECDGGRSERWPHSVEDLQRCRPVYAELPGWKEDVSGARRLEDLPRNAREYLALVEEHVGVPLAIISVGPDRAQTISLRQAF